MGRGARAQLWGLNSEIRVALGKGCWCCQISPDVKQALPQPGGDPTACSQPDHAGPVYLPSQMKSPLYLKNKTKNKKSQQFVIPKCCSVCQRRPVPGLVLTDTRVPFHPHGGSAAVPPLPPATLTLQFVCLLSSNSASTPGSSLWALPRSLSSPKLGAHVAPVCLRGGCCKK